MGAFLALELFPIRWSHLIDKRMRRDKELEHAPIRLDRIMLQGFMGDVAATGADVSGGPAAGRLIYPP